MMEGDGFCYPPHIKDVPTDDGLVWGAVADEVASPIARARRNDLCFEGHWGNVGDRGRAAVEAYLEMSTVDVYAVEEHRRPFVAIARVDWLAVWLSPSAPQEQIQHDDYEDHDDDGG
jgi:hypothetical protein